MSTFHSFEFKCAVCGNVSEYRIIGSTNAFGSSDLDLRPPQMERGTMPLWVHECPVCGYVANSVKDKTTVTVDFLKSPEYLNCSGIEFKSWLAVMFYKQYLILLHDGNKEGAFLAALHAAWACDDERDLENAVRCRKLALPLVTELIDGDPENKETLSLMRADIMRRAGLFSELKSMYSSAVYSEDLMNTIIKFELDCAEKEDTACYTVGVVLRRSARNHGAD